MPLKTVGDYVAQARVLLQDIIAGPYRYPDQDLVDYLSQGMIEARRLRPDIMASYFRADFPDFTADTAGMLVEVPMDVMYRNALLYYVIGKAQLRDDEAEEDARASGFMNKFVSQFLTIQS